MIGSTKSSRLMALWQAGLFLVLLGASNAWASESPLEIVRTTTNQALSVLQNGSAQRKQQLDKMWNIVLPWFDTQEIAQRSLGVHWKNLTEEQQKHFVQLFTQLVKKNYSGTLERYTKDAQFFFDQERVEGDTAEVQTRIQTPAQENSFSVTYRMHRQGGKWLVYDVVAENVSMVQNYRNQFDRIMGKSSYEGLVQALEKKLQETETTSS